MNVVCTKKVTLLLEIIHKVPKYTQTFDFLQKIYYID